MTLLQNQNFRTRTLTGLLFVLVVSSCVLLHQVSFFILVFIINLLCLVEFYTLTLEKGQRLFRYLVILTGTLPVILYGISFLFDDQTKLLGMITKLLAILPFAILFLQLPYRSTSPFANLGFAFLGWFYISMPLMLFLLNTAKFFTGYNAEFAMLLFVLVWINDTGAYLAGSLFGKTLFFERISPKKTWEGTLGGICLCILVSAAFAKFISHESILVFAGLGLVTGVFSTLGDLIESQLKRSLGIKDSGSLLPGHGGMLDRFDGFLMAMPAAFFYMAWIKG
jgi:phosphatidate cytidylyltransferase